MPPPRIQDYKANKGGRIFTELFISFGDCCFGEFEGQYYGKGEYDKLNLKVDRFQAHLRKRAVALQLRPWHFEIDPYPASFPHSRNRHKVLAKPSRQGDGRAQRIFARKDSEWKCLTRSEALRHSRWISFELCPFGGKVNPGLASLCFWRNCRQIIDAKLFLNLPH